MAVRGVLIGGCTGCVPPRVWVLGGGTVGAGMRPSLAAAMDAEVLLAGPFAPRLRTLGVGSPWPVIGLVTQP